MSMHRVAQFGDQGLDVGGDHRLVLDDQDFGGQFGVDLGLGLGDQAFDLGEVGVEDLRGLGGVKPSRAVSRKAWRERGAMRIRRCEASSATADRGLLDGALELGARAEPDGVEHVIERDARRQRLAPATARRRPAPRARPHIVVAGGLVAGQGAGVAANIGQMRRQPGEKTHDPSRFKKVFDKKARSGGDAPTPRS
jgi:hypothetical protein